MEDKSLYNSQQSQGISETLQNFIDSMVEEIVLEGKPFDTQRKYLKKFSENEGMDYERLEADVYTLIEMLNRIKTSHDDFMVKLAEEKSKDCYLSPSVVSNILSILSDSDSIGNVSKTEIDEEYLLDNNRQQLYRIIRDGKFGFEDESGKIVIPCEWSYADAFTDGLAVIGKNKKYGVIDYGGNIVTPCKWQYAFVSEGMICVRNDDAHYGFHDRKGKEVIPCQYSGSAGQLGFVNGLSICCNSKGKYGFIDKRGNIVIPFQWDDVGTFTKDGYAMVKKNTDKIEYGIIDKEGNLVTPCQWDFVNTRVGSKVFAVQNQDRKWGLIDLEGNQVISCQWDNVYSQQDNLCLVQGRDYRFGYMDGNGEMVIPFQQWKEAKSFSDGMAIVKSMDGKWGAIDKSGKLRIPYKYTIMKDFGEGLAFEMHKERRLFKEITLSQFIDKNGQPVISGKWISARTFSEGLVAVKDERGQWGYIDKNGRTVIPFMWAEAFDFDNGIAYVKDFKENEFFVDTDGNLAPYRFKF